MHEIEDFVEMSVRVLDSCVHDTHIDLRSIFYHLYNFQENWDTGFTHFRLIDILIKHRFVYQLDMTAYPDYTKYQTVLDQIVEESKQSSSSQSIKFIRLDPNNNPDSKAMHQMSNEERRDLNLNNPFASYYSYPFLYTDAGSALWEKLVEVGQLTGADAEAPDSKLNFIDIGNIVLDCAEKQQNYDVMLYWYAILPYHLVYEDISQDLLTPALESLINRIHSCDALNKSTEHAPYLKRYIEPLSQAKTAKEYLKAVEKLMKEG